MKYSQNKRSVAIRLIQKASIFWALIGLIIIMTILSPVFLTPRNIANVIKQITLNGILAIGMTTVILTGGIDLSVGSVVALSSIVAAIFGKEGGGYPILVPIVLGILTGTAIGAINGFGVSYLRIPPFIVTLSTMTIVRGVALLVTNGVPVFGLSAAMISLANGTTLGLPNLIFFLLATFLIVLFLLNATVFGKRIYAVGGNEAAARYAGVNARGIKTASYTICGFCAGLAGVLVASRITSGNPTTGDGYELDAIAAAVIGGVSMSGGKGFLLGTIVGALIIGVVQNGLDILGISTYYQDVIQGVIILVAVLVDIRNNAKE